jgi:hypothetical protein
MGRVQEDYDPIPTSVGTINYVTELLKLDLQLTSLSDGDIFTVALDGNTTVEVRSFSEANGFRLALKTINTSRTLFNQTIASGLPQGEFIINLLNPDYKLSTDVLPFTSASFRLD